MVCPSVFLQFTGSDSNLVCVSHGFLAKHIPGYVVFAKRGWRWEKSHARQRGWGQDLWVLPVTSTADWCTPLCRPSCTHAPLEQPAVSHYKLWKDNYLVLGALLLQGVQWARHPPVAGFLPQPLSRQTETVRHCWTPSLVLMPSALAFCLFLFSTFILLREVLVYVSKVHRMCFAYYQVLGCPKVKTCDFCFATILIGGASIW